MACELSDEVREAVAECERFLARVRALEAETKDPAYCGTHPIHCGAVKRASMDLTRALAVLRRGRLYSHFRRP